MLRFRVTELLVNNEKRWGGHDYDRYGSVQLLAADGIFNHPNASAIVACVFVKEEEEMQSTPSLP